MPRKLEYRAWLPILRKIVFILLIVCLFAVILLIILSSGKRLKKTESFVPSENQVLTLQEKFQAVEFSGQKRKISLKAEKFYLDEAGNQHLEGQVEVVDEEVPEKIILCAQKMVIDSGKRKLQAEGRVEIKSASLLIQAPVGEYNLEEKKIFCLSGAKIVWQNLYLSSQQLSYAVESQEGNMGKEVIAERLKPGSGFKVRTQKLRFVLPKNLFLAEEASLQTEHFEGKARQIVVLLNEDKDDFEKIEFDGKAIISWYGQEYKSDFTELKLTSGRLNLFRKNNFIVLTSQDEFQVQGKGEVWQMVGRGRNLSLDFSEHQKAEMFRAEKASLKFFESTGAEFVLSGQTIEHNLSSGKLLMSGEAKGKFKDYELQASRLSFQLLDRHLEAEDARLTVGPGFFSQETVLFKKDEPLFITGFLALSDPKTVELTGKVRIWQGNSYLLGEKAELEKETGKIELQGRVRASLQDGPSSEQAEGINISGQKMTCFPEKREAQVSGSAGLQKGSLKLQADELRMYFEDKAPDRLSVLEAWGAVTVFWKEYRAKSQQAMFKPAENTVIMSGLPELSNLQGDRLEADKLTLCLSDDKIQVENQKRERSLTILVRGK
jgi:lipopolysaccharide export system protein LptA